MVRIRTDVNSTVNKPLALSIYIPYRIAKVAPVLILAVKELDKFLSNRSHGKDL